MFNREPDPGHYFESPSQTIPDQAMSVREIMTRFTSGMPIGGNRTEYWDEDESNVGINIKKLDLVDIQTLKSQTAFDIKNLTKQLEEAKKNLTATPSENKEPEGH